jgi:hypothetical protein
MGAVFRPTDLGRGNRKIIENAIKDLSPDTRDNVSKLLDSWEKTEADVGVVTIDLRNNRNDIENKSKEKEETSTCHTMDDETKEYV